MKCPRIHIPQPLLPGERLLLPVAIANHVRVLRLRPGDPLQLFNGEGGEYAARLLRLERREVEVEIGAFSARERESPVQITLLQGISKGERMDYTIQKAVELGVSRILPVFSQRSVVQLDGERLRKRHEHWTGVVVAACEQSGRNRLPQLLPPQELAAAWSGLDEGLRLVLDPTGSVSLQALQQQPTAKAVTLLIGPEGGLDAEEIEQAVSQGFQRLLLGPRVLRTETAGVAALAALQLLMGDLG